MGIQQEKRRKGGCSSFSENLNGPYTLIDNAVVKTGGAKKRSSHKKSSHKKPSHKKPSPKRGGNVVSDLLTKQNGGSFADDFIKSFEQQKGGHLRRKRRLGGEGEPPAAPPATNTGSSAATNTGSSAVTNTGSSAVTNTSILSDALSIAKKTLGAGANGGGRSKKGSKKESKRRGGVGVELAPFAAAVALLAARVFNDPEFNKTSTGSKKRTSSKKHTTKV